ncbi:MAG: CehA/McbA family metallohydrolase [Hyphomonadaceae bacterium]|nr:CehA/McbA family metallohydrolase [Hyphomonadaceae bacterium]
MRAATLLAGFLFASCAQVSAAPESAPVSPPPIASLTEGVWLKGDLHIHSRHSKDSSNNPVSNIIAFGQSVGMDFLAITDHDNHVDGAIAQHTWADPEFRSDSVLLLYGAEWTTHRGHGTPLSAAPYDHQKFYDVRDQRDVQVGAVKKELGLHLSANHPGGNDHFGFSYDIVDSMEVWNSAVWSRNAASIMIWDDMLKSGRMIAGRGGSDSHHGFPPTPEQKTDLSWQAPANNVGTPTTWVFSAARTSQAVIDALTSSRASISANPYAPRIDFHADRDADGAMDMMMGDNAIAPGNPVTFRVQLAGATPPGAAYTVSVVKNGSPFGTFEAAGAIPTATFTDTPAADARTYYRVTVEGTPTPYPEVPESQQRSGNMIGLSNPIYFNFDPEF